MISLNTDEPVSDADYELIEAFCTALIDKDLYAMKEVLYVLDDKMFSECVCLEETCICGRWQLTGLFVWFVCMVCLLMVTSDVTIKVIANVTIGVTSGVTN